jgi:hypothetical protein
MATLIWTGAAKNGNWDDPLNWSIGGQPAGRIPGNGDDVDMGGAPHLPFPTLSSNAAINSVVVNETTFVASGATLNVANSLSVVSSFVDMSFDVAGTVQAGAITNLDANGLLSGGQRTHFVIEAGGTLVDRDTPGAASPIDTLLTNVSLGVGSKFEVFDGTSLIDITASLSNVSGTATLTNELSLNAHNTPFLNSINVISNGLITLVNDDFKAAGLFIDASSIVGGVGSIAVAAQSITNNGQLWSESQGTSSLVIANDVVGTGTIRLFDDSTLEFTGAVASSETINFDAPENGEKLIIDAVNASGFAATLHGFTTLDSIDLTHTTATSAVLDGSDLLAFRDKNGATVATLQLTGDYTGDTFLVSGDGGTGSLLTVFNNAPPVTTTPASEIVSKGTPFAFTGANLISVVDPDAQSGTGENITVVLTDTTGLLSAFVNGAGGGAIISGSGTQQLTISGGLGQVNAALGTLSFLSNSLGADQIDVATSDGRGGSDDHKIAVSVVANQQPVTTAPASELASEGTLLAFTGADQISVADPDAQRGTGENITVVLTDSAGLLSAFVSGAGGAAIITGSGTPQLTISGGLGQVNAALGTLSFLGNTLGPDQIDVATNDGRGGSDDHKIAVSVVANQPPVTTAPASELVSRNTPFAFTGADQISVNDPDAFSPPGETITVVLTDTSGLLSAFVPGSGGTAHITGSGTQQLTISGGLNQVNAALASLSLLSNTLGPDLIDVASSDGRGGSDDHKIAVNVVANQPPVTTVPASETVSKGTPLAFTGADQISVADPDAFSPPDENITVVLTDSSGQLSAFVPGSGGTAHITGSGTQQLTISGGLNQVNAALATLSFLGNTVGPDQIDVATSDGRGGSDDHKIAVTVTPSTNVPFSIVAPSAALTGVNQAGSISGISLVENPTTPGETFSIVISDANGALSASTLAPGGGGTIVNSGANTLTITGTLDQVNADLTTLTDTNTSAAPDSLFMLASNSNGENAPVVSVDVTVNGAPTITTPSDVRAPAGLATPVPLMKVSETGNTAGEFFVVILSDVNGLLSATFGGSPVLGSGTNHLTLSGSLDQVNAQLASLTITETAVGLDFITGGVGDGFGNGSGQFMIPVVGEKNWTSTVASDPNNWNNAANWTTSGAPVAGQDIFIPGAGPQPIIFDGSAGLISGSVTNNGTITLGSSVSPTTLVVDGNVALFGAGKVVLSDARDNIIQDSGAGTLENTQTIEGAGIFYLIGPHTIDQSLTLQNDFSGIINATGVNALLITGAQGTSFFGIINNTGLIEASGAGGLVLDTVHVTNNGTIAANNGSHVDIVDAQLFGTGGLLAIAANATLDISNTSVGASQTIQFLKGVNEILILDEAVVNNTDLGAHISGFAAGDKIDLAQLKITSATLDGNARLHLLSGSTEIGSLQLDASNLGERFAVTGDGGAGSTITIAPVTLPKVTESLARDTGASATDRITYDPTLAGTGDPFAIVTLTEGGVPVGTATADATGAWIFAPVNLSQGSHTIIASETNAAGAGQASLTFTYDSLAPHMAITTPDAQIANPLLTVSGTGEAGTQIQLFDNTLNIGGSVTVDAAGHWSEQITLVGTGTHFITAADTDLAGNFGSSGVATFTLDNQIVAPITQASVVGTTGADHITISQSNILVGAGAGNDTITLTPGGNFQFHFLNGGPGNDTLDLSQIAGNVTANLAQDTLVGSQVGFSVLNSIENVIAGSGNERLIGSSGANVFQAGAGTDTLTGNGGGDTFVFKPGFGKAVITDFHVAATNANPHDLIELDHSLFPQFATVQALLASAEVSQSGSSVVIAADPTHTIELQHTSLRTLVAHANDVLFV